MFDWFKRKSVSPGAKSEIIRREYTTAIAGIECTPKGVALVRRLRVGDVVRLIRESDNMHDKNALAVCNKAGERIGYVPAGIAAEVARALDEDNGILSTATVIEKPALGRDHKKFNAVLRFHLVRQRRR